METGRRFNTRWVERTARGVRLLLTFGDRQRQRHARTLQFMRSSCSGCDSERHPARSRAEGATTIDPPRSEVARHGARSENHADSGIHLSPALTLMGQLANIVDFQTLKRPKSLSAALPPLPDIGYSDLARLI